jgi:large subunit ribosomal protein L23
MDIRQIIIKPIVTEKTNALKAEMNQIAFEVHRDANRIQIKYCIEHIFNVHVEKVNTIAMKGKYKRRGKILGKRRDWKKAIVSLAAGEKIAFFEGVS